MTEIKIIHSRPPNFDLIASYFPMAHRPTTIFAYGHVIYVPSGDELSPALLAHETVHCERQLAMEGGVGAWWGRYVADLEFRYEEELLAHRAEYKTLIATASSRQQRRAALKQVAKRLASPLYGSMVTRNMAAADILKGMSDVSLETESDT